MALTETKKYIFSWLFRKKSWNTRLVWMAAVKLYVKTKQTHPYKTTLGYNSFRKLVLKDMSQRDVSFLAYLKTTCRTSGSILCLLMSFSRYYFMKFSVIAHYHMFTCIVLLLMHFALHFSSSTILEATIHSYPSSI